MTIRYDAEADATYVRFSDARIARTEEESDVCVLDLDAKGNLAALNCSLCLALLAPLYQ